ncbi:hypothetical protein T10_253 [Trichinella papuae]|uniref:Uncharacterized protein n=1 Tax=Trichinella papuae TaxID=268474 RepID=A0A0V1MTD1_9BILA|nr:hypothetical protein T10_253 [Trichinella papuae]
MVERSPSTAGRYGKMSTPSSAHRRMIEHQMNLQKFPEYQLRGKSKIKVMLMQSTSRLKNSGMTKVQTPHPNCNRARGLGKATPKPFPTALKHLP